VEAANKLGALCRYAMLTDKFDAFAPALFFLFIVGKSRRME
jgi:hypothetical protein